MEIWRQRGHLPWISWIKSDKPSMPSFKRINPGPKTVANRLHIFLSATGLQSATKRCTNCGIGPPHGWPWSWPRLCHIMALCPGHRWYHQIPSPWATPKPLALTAGGCTLCSANRWCILGIHFHMDSPQLIVWPLARWQNHVEMLHRTIPTPHLWHQKSSAAVGPWVANHARPHRQRPDLVGQPGQRAGRPAATRASRHGLRPNHSPSHGQEFLLVDLPGPVLVVQHPGDLQTISHGWCSPNWEGSVQLLLLVAHLVISRISWSSSPDFQAPFRPKRPWLHLTLHAVLGSEFAPRWNQKRGCSMVKVHRTFSPKHVGGSRPDSWHCIRSLCSGKLLQDAASRRPQGISGFEPRGVPTYISYTHTVISLNFRKLTGLTMSRSHKMAKFACDRLRCLGDFDFIQLAQGRFSGTHVTPAVQLLRKMRQWPKLQKLFHYLHKSNTLTYSIFNIYIYTYIYIYHIMYLTKIFQPSYG